MVVAFYFRLHLAYFSRPAVAISARPEHQFLLKSEHFILLDLDYCGNTVNALDLDPILKLQALPQ